MPYQSKISGHPHKFLFLSLKALFLMLSTTMVLFIILNLSLPEPH